MIDQAETFALLALIAAGAVGGCGAIITFAYVACRAMLRDM
jgi:hypothetical protein